MKKLHISLIVLNFTFCVMLFTQKLLWQNQSGEFNRISNEYIFDHEKPNQECHDILPNISYIQVPDTKAVLGLQEDSCITKKDVRWTMLTIIKSPVLNKQRRQLIRRTWGRVHYVEGGRFSIMFVTGRAVDGKAQNELNNEQKTYGDILQVDISDDYQNVVFKTLAGMQWVYENLPEHYLYSTADDDFIVNMRDVQEIIDQNFKRVISEEWPEFPIVCMHSIRIKNYPKRAERNKNHISKKDYKWTIWPIFCLGGMYTTSSSVIKALYKLALSDKPLSTDDIWITGLLRNQLGMPDSMVIKPPTYPAMHYGYLDQATFDGMKYWKNISQRLKGLSICMGKV